MNNALIKPDYGYIWANNPLSGFLILSVGRKYVRYALIAWGDKCKRVVSCGPFRDKIEYLSIYVAQGKLIETVNPTVAIETEAKRHAS